MQLTETGVTRPAVRNAFRRAVFMGAICAAPVFLLHGLLFVWAGFPAWSLLSLATILLLAMVCMIAAHARYHRPLLVVAIPALFIAAYCIVLAAGFGASFGFHLLLVPFLPIFAGPLPRLRTAAYASGAIVLLCVLWGEFVSTGSFFQEAPEHAFHAVVFRFVNFTATLVLLAVAVRAAFEMGQPEGSVQSLPASTLRDVAGAPERRRVTESSSRSYLHFSGHDRVFSVIFIEADHHDDIAEIFGFDVAESIVWQMSALVMRTLRETDMISRSGRQGFLAFLPDTVEDDAYSVGERVRLAVASHPLNTRDGAVRVTVTIGIARSEFNSEVEIAIEQAQAAVACGQKAGGNRTMLAGLL